MSYLLKNQAEAKSNSRNHIKVSVTANENPVALSQERLQIKGYENLSEFTLYR